jgi:hypothetical protein
MNEQYLLLLVNIVRSSIFFNYSSKVVGVIFVCFYQTASLKYYFDETTRNALNALLFLNEKHVFHPLLKQSPLGITETDKGYKTFLHL